MDTTNNAISVTVALSAPAQSVATRSDCGAWAIAGGDLLQFDAAGALTRQVSLKSLSPQLGPTSQVTLDPYDASLWVSDGKFLLHLSAHGALRSKEGVRSCNITFCFSDISTSPALWSNGAGAAGGTRQLMRVLESEI